MTTECPTDALTPNAARGVTVLELPALGQPATERRSQVNNVNVTLALPSLEIVAPPEL
ncbi:MAG: hypothetical protein GW892_10480 [Armatimonadetes bacterium]|nr:hypothetical protein [Armatimonadota bacterium]